MRSFRKIVISLLVCLLSAVMLSSCSYVDSFTNAYKQMFADAANQSTAETSVYEITSDGEDSFTNLLSMLADAGYSIDWEDSEPIFLSGSHRTITISEDKTLNTFIYPSEDEAKTESAHFSEDANEYSSASISVDITWNADPHLYLYGNMIILYSGSDAEFIAQLEEMFGPQFAGAAV